MRLPRLFGRAAVPTATPEPAGAPKRFPVDRARFFDLTQTHALASLLERPASQRDDAWQDAFLGTFWFASSEVATPAVFTGPDGFPYLRLNIPAAGAFESNALGNLATGAVDNATGVALFAAPDATEPAYVLSTGLLASLLTYDSWRGDPQDVAEAASENRGATVEQRGGWQSVTMTEPHEALVGTPSPAYLPAATARALHTVLRDEWGIATPRVQLMLDLKLAPSRSLIVNRRRADFDSDEQAATAFSRLLWYLPPRRTVMAMPDSMAEAEMTPLTTFFTTPGPA